MNQQKQREIIIVYGKSGSGKTTFAKNYIKEHKRVIIIDPQAEYTCGLVFIKLEHLINYYLNYLDINKDFCFVCRFETDYEHELIFKVCKIIGNLLLVVEEAEIYISPYAKSSNFLDLCRYGRHQNVSLLGIARRSAELSINFRALVTKIISFKQTEPADLKYLESLGFNELDKLSEYDFQEIIP